MFFLNTDGKNLEYLQDPENFDVSKPTLLILSNSYGILRYISELTQALNEGDKFNIFAFNLSGQGNSNGILSLQTACDDLLFVFDFLNINLGVNKDNFYLYINCSSLFFVVFVR